MKAKEQGILSFVTSDKKRIFLLDGIGALLTAVLMGLVLARLESFFGIPERVCICLGVVACVFALYSLSCFYFLKRYDSRLLVAIVFANILYALASLTIVFAYNNVLTIYGVLYLVIEVMIILALVRLEFYILRIKS